MQQAIITRQPLAIGIENSVSIKQFSIVLDFFPNRQDWIKLAHQNNTVTVKIIALKVPNPKFLKLWYV